LLTISVIDNKDETRTYFDNFDRKCSFIMTEANDQLFHRDHVK